jgi:uncharacterized protein (TIGR00251 family)
MKEEVLSIRVIPRSSQNAYIGKMADGRHKIKVTAAPVDGKANDAVIGLLAKQFHVSKSQIEICSGHTTKDKRVRISY